MDILNNSRIKNAEKEQSFFKSINNIISDEKFEEIFNKINDNKIDERKLNEDEKSILFLKKKLLEINKKKNFISKEEFKDYVLKLTSGEDQQNNNRTVSLDGAQIFSSWLLQKSMDERDKAFKRLELWGSFINALKGAVNLENDSRQQYPKYLTEHILMSYMIKTLNNEKDIEKLYQEISKQLSQNETNKVVNTEGENSNKKYDEINNEIDDEDYDDEELPGEDIEEKIEKEQNRLENLDEIINSANFIELSPYKTNTQENGKTYKIGEISADGKVQIASNVDSLDNFADCANIVIRHVVNLLTYSDNKNWDLLLDGADINDLNSKLSEVVDAINNKGQVQFYNLKTRLQMFFLYQSENGADDVTPLARTLWEYVICNMDTNNIEKGPDKGKGYYPIQYVDGKNFELETGYENMLKLMWNIASALNLGSENVDGKTKLEWAKENIDLLSSNKDSEDEDEDNENKLLQSALELTFKLFHLNDDLTISIKNEKQVNIKCFKDNQNLNFSIIQGEGHAWVKHSPIEVNNKKLEQVKKKVDLNPNDYALLLINSFSFDEEENEDEEEDDEEQDHMIPAFFTRSGFYRYFSGEDFDEDDPFRNTDFWKIGEALNTYGTLPDEIEYIENGKLELFDVLTPDVIKGLSKIKIRKQKGKNLSNVVYEEYLKKYLDKYYEENFKSKDKSKLNSESLQKMHKCEKIMYGTVEGLRLDPNSKETCPYFEAVKNEKNEVTLFIKSNKLEGKKLVIPAKVYDENKNEFKITGIYSNETIKNLDSLEFNGDFDDLNIRSFFNSYFVYLKQIKNLTFKGTIKNLEIKDTSSVPALESVEFSASVEKLAIKKGAFRNSKLKNFTISASVKELTIEPEAFANCSKLQKFTFEEGSALQNLTIGEYAFSKSNLTGFEVPASVKELTIESKAFASCSKLRKFTFEESFALQNLKIGKNAFAISGLTSFEVSASIKELTVYSYFVKHIEIPASVEKLTIEYNKDGDYGLEDFIVSKSVKELTMGKNAFRRF